MSTTPTPTLSIYGAPLEQGAIRPVAASFFGTNPNQAALAPYLQILNATREMFRVNGFTDKDAVFITSIEPNMGISTEEVRGQTVEMTAFYAAIRIAQKTHRVAKQSEIDQFHADQRLRENQCAEIESKRPDKPMTANELAAALNRSNMAEAPARPAVHKAGQENKN